MKRNLVLLAAFFSVILFASCKKNDDHPAKPNYANAAQFFQKHQIKVQAFNGDAATGFTITGNQGTKIKFPPRAFTDDNGNIITGQVQVKLTELYSKKNILMSGLMTETNGQLLASGGEINVEAQQNGKKLRMNKKLNPDTAVLVIAPRDTAVNKGVEMRVWVRGQRRTDDTLRSSDTAMTWVAAPYAPFGNGPNTFWFNLPDFRWCNIDGLVNNYDKTTIYVGINADTLSQIQHLEVMLIWKDMITVTPLPYGDIKAGYFASYSNSAPIGQTPIMVAIGTGNNGSLYFAKKEITIQKEKTYSISPHQATEKEVDDFLDSLK